MASYERNNWKKKKKSNPLPQEINVNRTIIQNPQDIAKEFNKCFTSVAPQLGKKILNTKKILQEVLIINNEKMQFEELHFDNFEKVFKSLKLNKVAGFDFLSSSIITDAYDGLKKDPVSCFQGLDSTRNIS